MHDFTSWIEDTDEEHAYTLKIIFVCARNFTYFKMEKLQLRGNGSSHPDFIHTAVSYGFSKWELQSISATDFA